MDGPPSILITVSHHPLLSISTFLLASTRSGLSQPATTNSPVWPNMWRPHVPLMSCDLLRLKHSLILFLILILCCNVLGVVKYIWSHIFHYASLFWFPLCCPIFEIASTGPVFTFSGTPTIATTKLNWKNYLYRSTSVQLWFLGQGYHDCYVTEWAT